jgi:S1-C subfamily serine protease
LLEGIPELGAVTFTRCRYEIAEVMKFVQDNPQVQLTAAGHDAFLGVSLEQTDPLGAADPFEDSEPEAQDEPGCTIQTVVEGSAAEQAGLRVGDAILEMDGWAITEFDALVLLIASKAPGDTIKVKVRQDGQVRDLEITLGRRLPGE